jgi:AhpD family alkylhydroperoxidase
MCTAKIVALPDYPGAQEIVFTGSAATQFKMKADNHVEFDIPNAREKASFLSENIMPIEESGQLKFVTRNGDFSKEVFKEGALDEKTKQLIAVASAHITQCPYCIKGHTKQAKGKGATNEEIMEAIWVASEMRAGAAYAHAALALDEMDL